MTDNWILPAHDIWDLGPRTSDYCVCIPIINEGERIQRQLAKMRAQNRGAYDVIIADGGSTDGAADRELLRSFGVRTLIVKTGPGKLGAQIRMGLAYALRQGYSGCILIDGNDKDDPSEIPSFIERLKLGDDFVQGSRFISGGRAVNNPLHRLLAIKLVHAPVISLAARHRFTDTTNGFRAFSRRFLVDERVAPFRDVFAGYELHYYLAIRAARLGFRVQEIPVTRSYPTNGPTPTKISFFRGNLKVMAALAQACLGKFDPPTVRS